MGHMSNPEQPKRPRSPHCQATQATPRLTSEERQKRREERARARQERESQISNPGRTVAPQRAGRMQRGTTKPATMRKTAGVTSSPLGGDDGKVHVGGFEISVRLLGTLIVVALVVLMVVPSVFQWWQQEREYRNIQLAVVEAQARNDQLKRELAMWDDPQFIASQARTRLGYVRPGETAFIVADPGEEYLEKEKVKAAKREGPPRPWMQIVALSVLAADQAPPITQLGSNGAQSGAQSGSQSGVGSQ